MKKLILFLSLLVSTSSLFSQIDYYTAFDIQATTQVSPPSVKLIWELTDYNKTLSIKRKLKTDAAWGAATVLPANATEYTDNTVQVGKVYEYYVYSNNAREYVAIGINIPLVDYRGKVLLVVDKAFTTSLASDINRLIMDIRGDGWQVQKIEVTSSLKPTDVKALIKSAYDADKVNVKAAFLLGQVALPLSGCTAPDGHGDHNGAWAADTYYADIDGNWTDVTANCTSGFNPNIPGDGKFDQNSMPSNAELQVGRVDMSNLPAFTESQTVLLQRYLSKDHKFRTKTIAPPRKSIVVDMFNMGFAWSGFYYFNAIFGKSNVKRSSSSQVNADNYLWMYACAPGESDGFVFENWHSSDFATKNYNSVFTMLFGSYIGDYQMGNNFLKASLASKGWILTTSWAGRPVWVYHHMGMGENIGYSALINMNNKGNYYGSYNGAIQINQLGDPTLRQDMIRAPMNVKSSVMANHVKITWSPPSDSIEGYHIYKAKNLDSVFTRVTSSILKDTFWTDPALADPTYYYQVKAYRMELTRLGSYANTSRGIFTSNDATVIEYPYIVDKPYVANPIPDKTGYIKSSFYFVIPSNTFADPDPADVLAYQVYKADSTALPKGWTYNSSTRAISVSPQPATPIKFKVVVKAIDQSQYIATDTFLISILDTTHIVPNGITANFTDGSQVCIYPNPMNGKGFIDYLSTCNCKLNYTITDIAGKIVREESYFVNEGLNKIEMDVASMPAGVYIIMLKANNVSCKSKFIISR